ncbi:MAG: hypothetical protein V4628_17185 [Pseudomonadota bacterium]
MQYKNAVCAITMLLVVGAAKAADSSYPTFVFNGFGTLGTVHSSEHNADFNNSFVQPDGAGATHDWAFSVDSRVGLQLTTNFSEKLSAVVQVVSEQRYDDSYRPSVEWANIKYDFTPDFSLRAGRIVLPSFIASDYRKVGFALYRVRPPIELYGMVPVTNSDGLDASYRFHHGELTNTVQAFVGRKNINTPTAGTWKAREIAGVINSIEFGDTLLRAGYLQSQITADSVNTLFNAFRQFGPTGINIADRYDVDDKPIDVWIVGGRYDPGEWFVMAEWARTDSQSFLGTDEAWYVSSGFTIGQFSPYAGVAQKNNLDDTNHPVLDAAFLPPVPRGFAMMLNAQLDNLLVSDESTTLTIGTRWDFRDDISLKLQLDRILLGDNSRGALMNIQPGFALGGDLNVVSAAIDFVF